MAAKLDTPPEGVATVVVGSEGRLDSGPSTPLGSGASQIGLTSDAAGAATEPGISREGGPVSPGPARPNTTMGIAATMVVATAKKAFPPRGPPPSAGCERRSERMPTIVSAPGSPRRSPPELRIWWVPLRRAQGLRKNRFWKEGTGRQEMAMAGSLRPSPLAEP